MIFYQNIYIGNKFIKVPDVIQVRNVYNLNINYCTPFRNILITEIYNVHYTIICDEKRLPVQADKYLLLAEKESEYPQEYVPSKT